MISPELLRRYPFFAGLNTAELQALAEAGDVNDYEKDHYFFGSEDILDTFYLLIEGEVGILMEITAHNASHSLADQLSGKVRTREIEVATVGPGEVFAWSALFPPHESTGAAKAMSPVQAVAFDASQILRVFKNHPDFGYRMLQKLASVLQKRLQDRRIELIAERTINFSS